MKKLLILLLVTSSAFSQTEKFSVEKSTLFWKFNLNESFSDYLNKLENNPKLEVKKSSESQTRGIAKNLKCNCSGTSIFMREEFDAEFIVNKTDSEISISVFNIRFKNYVHYAFAVERGKVEDEAIEKYLLKKDGTLRSNNQMNKNLECLDKYFAEIFR